MNDFYSDLWSSLFSDPLLDFILFKLFLFNRHNQLIRRLSWFFYKNWLNKSSSDRIPHCLDYKNISQNKVSIFFFLFLTEFVT